MNQPINTDELDKILEKCFSMGAKVPTHPTEIRQKYMEEAVAVEAALESIIRKEKDLAYKKGFEDGKARM